MASRVVWDADGIDARERLGDGDDGSSGIDEIVKSKGGCVVDEWRRRGKVGQWSFRGGESKAREAGFKV